MSELAPYGLDLITDSDPVDEKPLIWGKIPPAIHMFPVTTLMPQCACGPDQCSPATAVPPASDSVEPVSTDPDRALSEAPMIGSDGWSQSRRATAELDVTACVTNSDPEFNPSIKKLASLLLAERQQRKYSLPKALESEEQQQLAALAESVALASVEDDELQSVSECGSPPSPVVSELEFENLEPEYVYIDSEVDKQFAMAATSAFELTSSSSIPPMCSSTILSKAQVDYILNTRAQRKVSEKLLQEADEDKST